MINLMLGIFDFLEVLLAPLWIIVILVFAALLFVISKTIISEAKKRQKGIKSSKNRNEFLREIEPYSDIPYVRITFDGKKPVYNELVEDKSKDEEINGINIAAKDAPIEAPKKTKAKSSKKN